jgi:hypothetical protein
MKQKLLHFKKLNLLLLLVFLFTTKSTKAQNYQFLGFTNEFWTEVTNWEIAYPGTTIPAGNFCRVSSNFSLGKCSLDVNIVNDGRLLLQSKFYLNGHTLTNNDLIEITGTIYGDISNESSGTLSPGWEPFFPTLGIKQVNGSLSYNDGKMTFDFDGDDDSWDGFQFTSTTNLGGEIEIRFKNDFVPELNTNYTIIYTNTVVGTFATETWPPGVEGNIIYESNKVHVQFIDLPLSVEFTRFEAKKKEKNVSLEWETASEKDNTGFEIEQSTDGSNWRTIGFVDGQGTTSDVNQYSFIDQTPFLGDNYYRLKQIDFDGKFEYSEVRQVFFDQGVSDIVYIYPNPVDDHFTVGVMNPERKRAEVKLFSSSGQMIWQQTFSNGEMGDYWEKEFTLPQREMYFVVTQVGQDVAMKKVVPIRK